MKFQNLISSVNPLLWKITSYSILFTLYTLILNLSLGMLLALLLCLSFILLSNFIEMLKPNYSVSTFVIYGLLAVVFCLFLITYFIEPQNYVVAKVAGSMWFSIAIWIERFFAESKIRQRWTDFSDFKAPFARLLRRLALNAIFVCLLLWKGDMIISGSWNTTNYVHGILVALIIQLSIFAMIPYRGRYVEAEEVSEDQ